MGSLTLLRPNPRRQLHELEVFQSADCCGILLPMHSKHHRKKRTHKTKSHHRKKRARKKRRSFMCDSKGIFKKRIQRQNDKIFEQFRYKLTHLLERASGSTLKRKH